MQTKTWLFLFLCATLLLAGCGGTQVSRTIDASVSDFQFTPSSFAIPAGEEISLHVVNNGAVVHNFVIMKLGTTAGDTFDAADDPNVYWQERDIQPGSDTTTSFTAPSEPGEYQVICRTPGHIMSGMIAKLIVVAGDQ